MAVPFYIRESGFKQFRMAAGIVEQILLGNARIGQQFLRESLGVHGGHHPLHPHIHRQAFDAVEPVEQRTVGHLDAHPRMRQSSAAASSVGREATWSRSTSPEAVLRAASRIYLARNPLRSGWRSSSVRDASTSGPGKELRPPGSGSPQVSQRVSTMPRMRLMLLFWLMMKEQSASQRS